MYVKDDATTTRYQEALASTGASARHAGLIQVDRLDPDRDTRRRAAPAYRVTTGSDVVRKGRAIRRILLLWYVDDGEAMDREIGDANSLSTVVERSIAYMTAEDRATFERPAVVIEMGSSPAKERKAA